VNVIVCGIHPARPLTAADGVILLYDIEKSYVNAGMPEKSESGNGISPGSQLTQLHQSGIGIPASGSVR
jgi:hypothetical protein